MNGAQYICSLLCRLLTGLICLLAHSLSFGQNTEISVELVSDGDSKELSPEKIESIVEGVEAILATCNYSSAYPIGRIDWPEDKDGKWRFWMERDHALIRYSHPTTLSTLFAPESIQELMLPFPRGQDIPGIPLSNGPYGVTLYSLCHGYKIVELTCSEGIEPAMPRSYQAYCRDFRENGRPVFYRQIPE